MQLRVLRHRSLAAGSILSMIVGIGLYGTVFLIPIFAQGVLHFTAIQTGLLMLPGALASGANMLVLSKKVQQLDPRRVIAAGSICTSLVMFALAGINPNTGEEALFWPLIFRGIGTVLMFLPLSLAALGEEAAAKDAVSRYLRAEPNGPYAEDAKRRASSSPPAQ